MATTTPIRFRCAACEHELEVPATCAGRRGTYSKCKTVVRVPGPARKVAREPEPKPAAPAAQEPQEANAVNPFAALVMGIVFSGAGLLMASRLLSGEAEFVHAGRRTGHALVSVLGPNVFMVLATIVCLLLGFLGLAGAFITLRERLGAATPRA